MCPAKHRPRAGIDDGGNGAIHRPSLAATQRCSDRAGESRFRAITCVRSRSGGHLIRGAIKVRQTTSPVLCCVNSPEHQQSSAHRPGWPTVDKRAIGYSRVCSVGGRSDPEYHTLEIQRSSIQPTAPNHGDELVDVLRNEDQSCSSRNRPQLGIATHRILASEEDAIIAWKASRSAKAWCRNSLHTYPHGAVHCHRRPRQDLRLATWNPTIAAFRPPPSRKDSMIQSPHPAHRQACRGNRRARRMSAPRNCEPDSGGGLDGRDSSTSQTRSPSQSDHSVGEARRLDTGPGRIVIPSPRMRSSP